MRKSNTENIGNLIQDFVKILNIDEKLKETQIINAWEKLVGKRISKATTNIYIRNHILFVHVSSSIVRQELSMVKEDLLMRLNTEQAEGLLDKIVIK